MRRALWKTALDAIFVAAAETPAATAAHEEATEVDAAGRSRTFVSWTAPDTTSGSFSISTHNRSSFAVIAHNRDMKYGALLGWGIVIYAVMSLVWSGLVIYGMADSFLSLAVRLVVLVFIAIIAGRSLRFHSWQYVLPYSVFWAATMALLDIVYTVPFSGWSIYSDWRLWVGYALVAMIPLLAPFMHRLPREHDV